MALARSQPIRRTRMATKPADTGPTPKARRALRERSGGRCELALPGCAGWANQWVHRLKRGMGGRHGEARELNNSLSSAYHGCHVCHAWQHANPAEAVDLHLMLREGDDPRAVPALYRGELCLLTDDGRVVPVSGGVL